MDKFYSFAVAQKPLKNKEAFLMVCGEDDELKNYEGIIKTYEIVSDYIGWKNHGYLIASHVNERGDILKTDFLEKAENIGRQIS